MNTESHVAGGLRTRTWTSYFKGKVGKDAVLPEDLVASSFSCFLLPLFHSFFAAMSSLRIPRFVRFSASFAKDHGSCDFNFRRNPTSPCTFTPGPEVAPCPSSRELSPSPHLPWYATFCPLIVNFHESLCTKVFPTFSRGEGHVR